MSSTMQTGEHETAASQVNAVPVILAVQLPDARDPDTETCTDFPSGLTPMTLLSTVPETFTAWKLVVPSANAVMAAVGATIVNVVELTLPGSGSPVASLAVAVAV